MVTASAGATPGLAPFAFCCGDDAAKRATLRALPLSEGSTNRHAADRRPRSRSASSSSKGDDEEALPFVETTVHTAPTGTRPLRQRERPGVGPCRPTGLIGRVPIGDQVSRTGGRRATGSATCALTNSPRRAARQRHRAYPGRRDV